MHVHEKLLFQSEKGNPYILLQILPSDHLASCSCLEDLRKIFPSQHKTVQENNKKIRLVLIMRKIAQNLVHNFMMVHNRLKQSDRSPTGLLKKLVMSCKTNKVFG